MMRSRRFFRLFLALSLGGLGLAGAQPSSESAASITELERRLEGLIQEERALRAELAGLDPQTVAIKSRMVARGRVLYRLTRAGLLPVGGGFEELVAHAAKVEKLRRSLEQDANELSQISRRRASITRSLSTLALQRGPLEVEQRTLAQARVALEEADDRRRAFERAFQQSSGPSDYVAIYGADIASADPLPSSSEGFRAMRGRLPFPLRGRTEIRHVRRPGAGGPGLELRAPIGAPVHAIYPGRVSFADAYEPFGQVVILDHGNSYYSLLGNLGSVDVRVGDDVPVGGRVGSVGGDDKGGVVYLELRRNADTLDPRPWFGL